jgi:hypothetical protein
MMVLDINVESHSSNIFEVGKDGRGREERVVDILMKGMVIFSHEKVANEGTDAVKCCEVPRSPIKPVQCIMPSQHIVRDSVFTQFT